MQVSKLNTEPNIMTREQVFFERCLRFQVKMIADTDWFLFFFLWTVGSGGLVISNQGDIAFASNVQKDKTSGASEDIACIFFMNQIYSSAVCLHVAVYVAIGCIRIMNRG